MSADKPVKTIDSCIKKTYCNSFAEAKGIAEGGAHGALLCLVEGKVEVVVDVFVVVAFFVVDGSRRSGRLP